MPTLDDIPEPLRRHCSATTPAPVRMLAARGAAPLPPKDLIIVQCALAVGSDEAIAAVAKESIRKHPDNILLPVTAAELPGFAFAVLGEVACERPPLLEPLLLNRTLSDDILAELVPRLPAESLQLVFGNEQRLLRSCALVVALRAHRGASPAQIDRMLDFLVRAGVVIEGIPEFTQALMRLSPQEAALAVKDIAVPEDLIDHGEPPAVTAQEAPPEADADAVAPDPDAEVKEPPPNIPLLARLQQMSIAQKVAVAVKGNREVRTQLLRDPNKMVAVATIKNPRLTEPEVLAVAQSRSVHEEVVRIISMNGEWTRSYGVKLALVTNPKTPLPVAMKYLPLLKGNDVKNVAKSKNIPSAVVNQAKILRQKSQH